MNKPKIDIVNLLIIQPKTNKILIVERAKNDEIYGGLLAFPGGHIEEGESASEAANRELLEETNTRITLLTSDPVLVSPLNHNGRIKHIGVYLCEVEYDQIQSNTTDISDVRYVPAQELIHSLLRNKYPAGEVGKLKNVFQKMNLL